MRRLHLIPASLVALGLVLSSAATAMAKGEDAIVTLDSRLPVDAPPGSTVQIAWSVDIVQGSTTWPFNAEGVFVRLTPASGKPVEVMARQDRPGHYVATVEVPRGGLGRVLFGRRGVACQADGRCAPSDEYFRVGSETGGFVAPMAQPPIARDPAAQTPAQAPAVAAVQPAVVGAAVDATWLAVAAVGLLGLVAITFLGLNRRPAASA
jgi:hypothetical protein